MNLLQVNKEIPFLYFQDDDEVAMDAAEEDSQEGEERDDESGEDASEEEEEYESMTVTWGEDTKYDADYNVDEEMQL